MGDLILTTFDWVPDPPRGFVRDLRVRWALEEARLPYRVESVSFDERDAEHLAHQPFGQVPWLTDGDISIFESGAILLHLAERTDEQTDRLVRAWSKRAGRPRGGELANWNVISKILGDLGLGKSANVRKVWEAFRRENGMARPPRSPKARRRINPA